MKKAPALLSPIFLMPGLAARSSGDPSEERVGDGQDRPDGSHGRQKAESQPSSRSMGGADASAIDGDGYAYDAAPFSEANG